MCEFCMERLGVERPSATSALDPYAHLRKAVIDGRRIRQKFGDGWTDWERRTSPEFAGPPEWYEIEPDTQQQLVMAASDIQPYSVVRLKSGGPDMTVLRIVNDQKNDLGFMADCAYSSPTTGIEFIAIQIGALVLV